MAALPTYTSSVLNSLNSATDQPKNWLPPLTPWIKINVDATVRDDRAAGAAVATDDKGVVLAIRTTGIQCTDPLVAEASALQLGFKAALENRWQFVVIEGCNYFAHNVAAWAISRNAFGDIDGSTLAPEVSNDCSA
ncbi:hypothetical protein TorRG33x02_159860 [Trema orientale]|uniref:RNase H type-1 domain-containing protein n=1 Tax=Trema orientale TaxID=63057 RepID=A0A2P5ERI3_TREOI|nr:hypothetical protein TorRG33x02_159860 [Trema orientale]